MFENERCMTNVIIKKKQISCYLYNTHLYLFIKGLEQANSVKSEPGTILSICLINIHSMRDLVWC